jgi:hypothetical protein
VTRHVDVDTAAALDLAEMFSLALERQADQPLGKRVSPRALTVVLAAANTPDAAVCAGAVDCAAALGRLALLEHLVSVQLARLGPDLIVDATLIDVASGTSELAINSTIAFDTPAPGIEALAQALVTQAKALTPVAAPPQDEKKPEPLVTDLPRQAPEPAAVVAPAAGQAAAPEPKKWPPTPVWCVGAPGAGVLIAGGALGAVNLSLRSRDAAHSDGTVVHHALSYSQARLENTTATLAPTFLAVGGALVGTAVIWAIVTHHSGVGTF